MRPLLWLVGLVFSYLFKRVCKFIIAVAHSILVIAYHLLSKHEPYQELGANYHDRQNVPATTERLTKRLQKLGFQVTLEPLPEAVPA